ncbi:hypothetical protein [Sphingorhabdus sp. SMR4y]|uniref:hypothetical protein n=1 Tax=Sphingorhabdus sp. SMR4y TaxID=2584094 RepID=UPI000B5F9DB3|nr:hypothetical protein [Sphingorhabdus sp. SMR4y]ASK88370.1 hypothetical protein SPHFLASMR4Y_01623 [Sphingorhabdus sp. SMR4y]
MEKFCKGMLALIAPMLLAGCLLVPGKFDSQLRLMNDGTYSFTYIGQMQLAEGKGDAVASQSASADDEETDSNSSDDDQKNAAMRSIFGGAVPGDDEGLTIFAEKLAKYDGWNKVEYMGNNLFEVEYAVSGTFDRMLAFPTIPGAIMQFPFVQIIRRDDGELEVLTPAMAGAGGLASTMGPLAMGSANAKSKAQPIDGTFTIVTDGAVLSNNTEDGLTLEGRMKKMRWKVDATSVADGSPRAIIKLTN